MKPELSEKNVSQLFKTILQHMKCIQVRLEFGRMHTSQKQKMVLNQAIAKTEGAINHICALLPNSDAVMQIKKELDKTDLVYVMVYTEQLMRAKEEDYEPIATMIEEYIEKKYGKENP
jgi:hypothetical protein